MPGSEEKESEGWGEAAAEVEALAAGEAEPAGGGRMVAQAPASHPLLLYTPTEYMDKQLKGQSGEVEAVCWRRLQLATLSSSILLQSTWTKT
jgi:hypothetical protein